MSSTDSAAWCWRWCACCTSSWNVRPFGAWTPALTDDEIERLGLALMRQTEEIERLRKAFGLKEEDLNIDLGPLGKLL